METNIQVFENEEFGQLRTLNLDGVPYAVGKDVASILGYTNSRKAIADHVDDEDKITVDLNRITDSVTNRDGISDAVSGGWIKNEVTAINESGIYSLIFSSRLPKAKKFKRWVTSEVLPAIRKTGFYAVENYPRNESLTLKEKINTLKDLAMLVTDELLKTAIIRKAAELATGEPLILTPRNKKPTFHYDIEHARKFLKDWVQNNALHFSEAIAKDSFSRPRYGFYHQGYLCIQDEKAFLDGAKKAGFENPKHLLKDLAKDGQFVQEEGKIKKRIYITGTKLSCYVLMLKNFKPTDFSFPLFNEEEGSADD